MHLLHYICRIVLIALHLLYCIYHIKFLHYIYCIAWTALNLWYFYIYHISFIILNSSLYFIILHLSYWIYDLAFRILHLSYCFYNIKFIILHLSNCNYHIATFVATTVNFETRWIPTDRPTDGRTLSYKELLSQLISSNNSHFSRSLNFYSPTCSTGSIWSTRYTWSKWSNDLQDLRFYRLYRSGYLPGNLLPGRYMCC